MAMMKRKEANGLIKFSRKKIVILLDIEKDVLLSLLERKFSRYIKSTFLRD